MGKRIAVVGRGIVGGLTAWHLAGQGHDVTLIDAGAPGATRASFGWINASFSLDAHHHRFRAEGMAAWHRLLSRMDLPVAWPGCLCWDLSPDEADRTFTDLTDAGYPVEHLTRAVVAAREPALADPPESALFFPTEGAVHSPDLPARIIAAARGQGARCIFGVSVTGLATDDDACTGIRTAEGVIETDEVVICAGTGTAALLEGADHTLPMLHRPAYMLRTTPVPPLLTHILATPIGEVRQEPDGRLLMPTAVSHQGDETETLALTATEAADVALSRLKGMLKGIENIGWSDILRAERPVPGDGRPVVGRVAPGLYVATLHSGITLGPLVAELASREIAQAPDNRSGDWLAPYRPDRPMPG